MPSCFDWYTGVSRTGLLDWLTSPSWPFDLCLTLEWFVTWPACALPSADVENVINFDFPPTPEAYVHRVGRYVFITVSCMVTGFCAMTLREGGREGRSCQRAVIIDFWLQQNVRESSLSIYIAVWVLNSVSYFDQSSLLKCCITKLSLRTEFTQFMDASVYLVYRSPSHVQNSIVGDTYIYRVLITTSNIMVSFTFPHCMHDTSSVPRRPSHVAWVWGMIHNDDISTVEPRLLDSPEKWTLRM